jgi:hypothetical protein
MSKEKDPSKVGVRALKRRTVVSPKGKTLARVLRSLSVYTT